MDEFLRAVKDAKQQAIIDKTNQENQAHQHGLAMDGQLVEDAKSLAKLLQPQVATKVEEFKKNRLADVKILTSTSAIPAPRKDHYKYICGGQSFYREPSQYYLVGKNSEIAGWWLFIIVKDMFKRHIYVDDGPDRIVQFNAWTAWLDTDCRIRYTRGGSYKKEVPEYQDKPAKRGKFGTKRIPIDMPGNEILEDMPGYIKDQAYDFSADIDQLDLATLVRLADALKISIPAEFRS